MGEMLHIHGSENIVTKIAVALKFIYYSYQNPKALLSKNWWIYYLIQKELQETKILTKEERMSVTLHVIRNC